MEKKASKLLLLLPFILIVIIGILIALILSSLNTSTATGPSTPPANNINQNSNNNQPAPPTNTTGNSAETDAYNKAIASIPKSGFPDNKCPQYLILESGGNKFVIEGEDKFTINSTQLTWIQSNCNEVKTLNF